MCVYIAVSFQVLRISRNLIRLLRVSQCDRQAIANNAFRRPCLVCQYWSIGKRISCDFAGRTEQRRVKKKRKYKCICWEKNVVHAACVRVCVSVLWWRVRACSCMHFVARARMSDRERQTDATESERERRGREGEREEGRGCLGRGGGRYATERRKKTVRPVAPSLAHKYKHSPFSVCAPSTGGLRVANIMVRARARARARAYMYKTVSVWILSANAYVLCLCIRTCIWDDATCETCQRGWRVQLCTVRARARARINYGEDAFVVPPGAIHHARRRDISIRGSATANSERDCLCETPAICPPFHSISLSRFPLCGRAIVDLVSRVTARFRRSPLRIIRCSSDRDHGDSVSSHALSLRWDRGHYAATTVQKSDRKSVSSQS